MEARAVKEFERAILTWRVPNVRSSRLWVEKRICVGIDGGGWLLGSLRLLRLPTVDALLFFTQQAIGARLFFRGISCAPR